MEYQDIEESLNWRYAVKEYDPSKKLNTSQWELLKKALQLAPSSYGLQPWKFIVVQNIQIRQKLREVSWGQSAIEDCSHLVVFTALKEISSSHIQKHISQTAKVRGQDPSALDGFKNFMEQKILIEKPLDTHLEWNFRQAYIAMGFLLETAALIKVDATPIEGLTPEKYNEILKLTETPYSTVAAVTLGFRGQEDQYQFAEKSRFNESDVIEILT